METEWETDSAMVFKDTGILLRGVSPRRLTHLGVSCMDALMKLLAWADGWAVS